MATTSSQASASRLGTITKRLKKHFFDGEMRGSTVQELLTKLKFEKSDTYPLDFSNNAVEAFNGQVFNRIDDFVLQFHHKEINTLIKYPAEVERSRLEYIYTLIHQYFRTGDKVQFEKIVAYMLVAKPREILVHTVECRGVTEKQIQSRKNILRNELARYGLKPQKLPIIIG